MPRWSKFTDILLCYCCQAQTISGSRRVFIIAHVGNGRGSALINISCKIKMYLLFWWTEGEQLNRRNMFEQHTINNLTCWVSVYLHISWECKSFSQQKKSKNKSTDRQCNPQAHNVLNKKWLVSIYTSSCAWERDPSFPKISFLPPST